MKVIYGYRLVVTPLPVNVQSACKGTAIFCKKIQKKREDTPLTPYYTFKFKFMFPSGYRLSSLHINPYPHQLIRALSGGGGSLLSNLSIHSLCSTSTSLPWSAQPSSSSFCRSPQCAGPSLETSQYLSPPLVHDL